MIIGIDMGGTHIDGAAIENGVLIASVKHQVDHGNYFASIWQCLEELLSQVDKDAVERIHLSTTISTNAIIEGRLADVALILQTGPGLRWHLSGWANISSICRAVSTTAAFSFAIST